MGKLTVDSDLPTKLGTLAEPVELCDEAGRVVGHFLPTPLYEDLFYAALAAESPHSKEELKRRHRESGGRTLPEIWKSLGGRLLAIGGDYAILRKRSVLRNQTSGKRLPTSSL